MRCVHGPCVAGLHVWVALSLIVPGCVHVCTFACALLLALGSLVCARVSCIDSDVHSGFEL